MQMSSPGSDLNQMKPQNVTALFHAWLEGLEEEEEKLSTKRSQ